MNNSRVVWLSPGDAPQSFPDVEDALCEPDGLLAAGGDLNSERLLYAYARGIFPWYEEGQPILWWSPDPRCVLRPAQFHISRRLQQYLRSSTFTLTCNTAFAEVIRACAKDRPSQQGTWITPDIIAAFEQLHIDGWAHSVEVWDKEKLVGGIYGMSIGKVFFGESMFSRRDNASKFAMFGLCRILQRKDFVLLDCQVLSQHLTTLGAELMPRSEFTDILRTSCDPAVQFDEWPSKVAPIGDFLPN
ncbi:MAG: leucyl/phenylalanyl-tRNA--protein transferase [Woeseiaceae bacterium]